MGYFLKKTNTRKKGDYLQIYESFYVPHKGCRHRSYKALGYVSDLKDGGIEDPIAYGKQLVDELNSHVISKRDVQVGEVSLIKKAGHFLAANMFDYLNADDDFKALSINKNFRFSISDYLRNMVYAQILQPSSKYKAFEKVIPSLFNPMIISYDQILDATNFVGYNYENYIEVLNNAIFKRFGKPTLANSYFDCTNYYFEADLTCDDKL